MSQRWPDLARRMREAARRARAEHMADAGRQAAQAILAALESEGGQRFETPEDYANHIRGCVDCKRRVMQAYKAGAEVRPLFLEAAGIDIIKPN